jgi:uncharacterized circularly permuted ATP-grasp superfamily protein/uncharacterized alpha-E superfamily protein
MAEILDDPLLTADYRQAAGVYDEMCAAPGVFRPHWDRYIASLSSLGGKELAHRWQIARQRIRDNGVSYNVYGDPLGTDRPWSLDAIPLLIPAQEWAYLEAGLIQRARLLNTILADLYGPQQLLLSGALPSPLVFGNPAFWRACHGVPVPNGNYLHLLAVDLARSPDGQWWVISDRTQAPSGAGYALENRIVLAETFPDLFREAQVHRLASFFRAFRDSMLRLAPSGRSNPRVVLLTPGPLNETYFEHSYLARYLGFTLVQGGDLTVRENRVYLKSLEGLRPVDVVLRRMDDGFCDPLELRSDSYLGVPGLVEAVRAGNVAVANALGSGLLETSAFTPFFPSLCNSLLGERLALPSVATWWCGQPAAFRYVRENLDFLIIKPAFPAKGMEPVFGGRLAPNERERLLSKMHACPDDFVGQELLDLSSVPVWSDAGLVPRRAVLRVYIANDGDRWIVMPGGLTRVSPSADTPVVSMQHGGGSKDTWVLSGQPVDNFTLRRPSHLPVELHRGISTDLPSRAAEHLFWLGRYAERCEHLARVLRCILVRMTGESWAPDTVGWQALMKLYEGLESPYSRLAKDDPQGKLDQQGDLEKEILSLIFEEQRNDSLNANLGRITRAAAQVRDRLSSDLLRIVSQLGSLARASDRVAWGYVSTADALVVLNNCILSLAALRGIEAGNITRGPGWHFLNIGRRVERSLQLLELLRLIVVPMDAEDWPSLEMLLEVADSSITYRSRYFTLLQVAPVVDLLMNDQANPRSLAFQLNDLAEHCASLLSMPSGNGWPLLKQRQMEAAAARLLQADVEQLCETRTGDPRMHLGQLLHELDAALPAFSEAIAMTYFSHVEMERAT